ncbi:radical SAM protein, partial [Candidatus Sumerlaeota bacterium]|nr:radical SAM protein [Candidatus Sumerlaeota bacterium]
SSGYQEINLIGTNVSAYGQDIGTNLPALLRTLVNIDGTYRLYLRNLEPVEVLEYLDEFTEVLKTGKIAYLELPLQSGSNRILKLMNRGYTVEEFVDCFWALKRAYPKLRIRSQVMVGFPSETEEEFQQTVKIATKLPFIYMEPFRFSPRPGTAAARLDGQLDKKLSKARYHKLRKSLMKSHLGSKIRFALSYSLQSLISSRHSK